MVFDSFQYWIFFAAVLLVVLQLDALRTKMILCIASFVFYGYWDERFVLLLLVSTVFNYATGLLIDSAVDAKRKLTWLTVAIASNLMLLGFFKYYNFFAGSLAQLLSLDPNSLVLNILLPVGISFFTFEGIAYNVDVYKRDIQARKNLIDFALFIAFFPHLIAGPIIRPHQFFPQVDGLPVKLTAGDLKWGIYQIIKGLLKKVVFADTAAIYADAYFNGHATIQIGAIAGVLAFGLQIYFDFAGYTDIARGCARLLGFRFPPNFARPYFATNISEFWRRWHISLSTWLRDYLYIPLGGSRGSTLLRYRNYIIVMALGGLWHGASWNYLGWGLYHGLLLAVHRGFLDWGPRSMHAALNTRPGHVFAWGLTSILVFIGWVPFRASSLDATLSILKQLFNWGALAEPVPVTLLWLSGASAIFCLLDWRVRFESWVEECASLIQSILLAGVCLWIISVLMPRDVSIPFIYFQF